MTRKYFVDSPVDIGKEQGEHFLNIIGYFVILLMIALVVGAIVGVNYVKKSDKVSGLTLVVDLVNYIRVNPSADPITDDFYLVEYPINLSWSRSNLEDRYKVYVGINPPPLTDSNTQITVITDKSQRMYPSQSSGPSQTNKAYIKVDSRNDTTVYSGVSVYYPVFGGLWSVEGQVVPADQVVIPKLNLSQ